MSDFFDVPEFDGKGLFSSAASASQWIVQEQPNKGMNKRPSPAAGAGAPKRVRGGRGREEAATNEQSGKPRVEERKPGVEPKASANTPAAEKPTVSGKNLGKRRRAKERRERLGSNGLAKPGVHQSAQDSAVVAARATLKQKQHAKKEAAASVAAAAVTSPQATASSGKGATQRPPRPAAAPAVPSAAPGPAVVAGKGRSGKGGGSLVERARAQLAGGRFRFLNEALYTQSGAAAAALFGQQPELFDQYHEGFRSQTTAWPRQPIDCALEWLSAQPAALREVADFGCGDAQLAAAAGPRRHVHSFDLVARAPGVVACNMAAVPLAAAAVDACVFCLSLMGTDYGAFLQEAHRVLRPGGALWIAEVRSRFEEGCEAVFLRALRDCGFELRSRDDSDRMFCVFVLAKEAAGNKAKKPQRVDWPALKACEYKRR